MNEFTIEMVQDYILSVYGTPKKVLKIEYPEDGVAVYCDGGSLVIHRL